MLLGTIRANGQEENTGKQTSLKHPNSFPFRAKGRASVFTCAVIPAADTTLFEAPPICDQLHTKGKPRRPT